MFTLPNEILLLLLPFSQLFYYRSWEKMLTLLIGAILCPGTRTVTSILKTLGLSQNEGFASYHHLFSRSPWSGLEAARILFLLILKVLPIPNVVIVVDQTIERRYGRKIKDKGNYRDAVRSSSKKTTHTDGLKWVVFTINYKFPYCNRNWALPFLSILVPSKAGYKARGREHKTAIDRTIEGIRLIRRWNLSLPIHLIGDGDFGNAKLGQVCLKYNIKLTARFRIDAALYDFASKKNRKKGDRLPSLKEVAQTGHWQQKTFPWLGQVEQSVLFMSGTCLWCAGGTKILPIFYVICRLPSEGSELVCLLTTDLKATAETVITEYLKRWSIEVTFEESRKHLGIETQRQWCDASIRRQTPSLYALFTLVSLMAFKLNEKGLLVCQKAAWYPKEAVTFSDAIAAVRRCLWKAKKSSDPLEDLLFAISCAA